MGPIPNPTKHNLNKLGLTEEPRVNPLLQRGIRSMGCPATYQQGTTTPPFSPSQPYPSRLLPQVRVAILPELPSLFQEFFHIKHLNLATVENACYQVNCKQSPPYSTPFSSLPLSFSLSFFLYYQFAYGRGKGCSRFLQPRGSVKMFCHVFTLCFVLFSSKQREGAKRDRVRGSLSWGTVAKNRSEKPL